MYQSTIAKLMLDNGLRLLTYHMQTTSFITIVLAVKAGSRYEPPDKPGLAHFLEHMLFRGTQRFPSFKTLSSYLEGVGGSRAAQTNRESAVYLVTVPHRHLDVAFTFLSELLIHPLLLESDIVIERGLVREEIRTQSGWDWIFDHWCTWVWGDQSIGRPIIGSERTISSFTKDDLTTFHTSLYQPTNMVLAIVGAFSDIEITRYSQKHFAGTRSDAAPSYLKQAVYVQKSNPLQVLHQSWQQVYMVLGFVSRISYTHPDRFAMRLVADVLATGSNSRLYSQLVFESGLSYSISAESWLYSDTGLFCIYGSLSPKHIEEGVDIILHELQRLKHEPVLSHELEVAKEKDKAWMQQSLQMPQSMAEWLATTKLLENRVLSPEAVAQAIDNVIPRHIQTVAQKCFTKENMRVLVVGPRDNITMKKLQNLIRDFE